MTQPSTERVTVVRPEDVQVAGRTVAVLRLGPEDGSDRPTTMGREGLANLEDAVTAVRRRAETGDVAAVLITGTGGTFLAGADLHLVRTIAEPAQARAVAEAGHRVVSTLLDLPVPSLAHLNGTALGGGLEIALACTYRTSAPAVRRIGLPETYLGLLPGWGGCTVLPRLIGADAALRVIVDNPARSNRMLDAAAAERLGIVDAVVEDEQGALQLLVDILTGERQVPRRGPDDDATWQAAVDARRPMVEARVAGGALAPARALTVVAGARDRSRSESFAAEDDALVDLIMSDQLRAGLYAFDLLSRRGKRPAGAPQGVTARPVRRVGVMGAGLMAGQLALLLARSLRVPVVMRELDDERAAKGLAGVHAQVDQMRDKGRLSPGGADALREAITVTTDVADLADADLVVEAVFEEMGVKQQVFAELEQVVRPDAVLATNTSALSVTTMAERLQHPERVVGLHFFNPVAQMPLVEVVRAGRTDDVTYATAFAVAEASRKTAIAVADAPGFVVNRLLLRLLAEVLGALEEGTDVLVADRALAPMGLPMGPFQLLQLVGGAVAEHVLVELRARLGERYPGSPGLARMVAERQPFVSFEGRPSAASPVRPDIGEWFGNRPTADPPDAAGLLLRVQGALAEETDLLLQEGVAHDAGDVDLGMLLGAGWPLHNGGLTPYLDRAGASEQVRGRRFHQRGVADLPTER
ncbi:3-hydroxyacyl-CoA dehydrogenase NAD-binding domain-containing protein [Georgenia sp. 10Sc9-8]|uniref:3-hydroxyacyl-CoA dehydrogenase NAD-binding domain-containing protein n=1 Tax=Georgenia halotolerans TaxID=3028317 RepID=A0ABT5TXU0_9MICO|nr:3-hydroxyacyl-CoA dehydrogenase NAD-binding domain-containing protein [Georgenia halotolerans]